MKPIFYFPLWFRRAIFLIIVGLIGIPSCATPSPTIAVSTPLPQPTVNEPSPSLVSPTDIATPLATIPLPTSTVEEIPYSTDANVLLVQAQTISPPRPPWFQCYVLPDLRIWGDGRVVRVMFKENKREVAVGYLRPDRIAQMLKLLQDQGALSPWPREMQNPAGSGFSFKVQLKAGVSENWSNSPPAFFPKLLDFLNADVKPLMPQQAFLIATNGSTSSDKVQELPARFDISLAQAMDQGIWISGDALNFFWDDANNGLSLHTFRQNSKMYAVALEIAGIGPKEPPEHCWAEWNKLLPRVEEITLDQARQLPGFHLLEPDFLPVGFRLQRVIHTTTVSISRDPTNMNAPATTHYFDGVSLEYGIRATSGQTGSQEFIFIGEQYSPDVPLPPGFPTPPATPDLHPEIATIRNARALVNRSAAISPPTWFTPEPGTRSYISLEWREPNYSFFISGSMNLEELIKMANSLK